jgi:hypothetical protein
VVAPPSLIALACAALVAAGVDAAAAQSPDASAIRPDPPPGASRPTPDPAPAAARPAAPQATRQAATTRSVPTPQPAGAAGAKTAGAPAKVRPRTKPRAAVKRRAPRRERDRDVLVRPPDAGLVRRAAALVSPAVPDRAVASGQSSVDGALLGAAALALLAVTAASASLVSQVSRASRTGRWG